MSMPAFRYEIYFENEITARAKVNNLQRAKSYALLWRNKYARETKVIDTKTGRAVVWYKAPPHVSNPCIPGGRKAVSLITDRAKRYRAEAANQQAERRCIYCGRPGGALMNEHINGKEADTAPANLAYACRSCNTAKGALFARRGLGTRTRQFNAEDRGAVNLAQWTMAVASIRKRGQDGRLRRGDSNKMRLMPVSQAVAMIRATPPDKRSEYARQIWSLRRQQGTDRGGVVPF